MFDVGQWVQSGGIILVSLIVFAESGLLIGFFLPGDTLLFAAGLAASHGDVSLAALIAAVVLAAIIGDNVGYEIGKRMGDGLFTRRDGILFRREYVEAAAKFYEKHGGKTIVLARFTPVVRTFAPVVAGATNMSHRRFFLYNVMGGFLWGTGMCLLGYFVGNRLPWLDQYMETVIMAIVVISILIAAGHILKDAKTRSIIKERARHHASRLRKHSRQSKKA